MRLPRRLAGVVLLAVTLPVIVTAAGPSGSDSVAGSAGTDTSLPATDSKVTMKGRGPFASLEVTANQTKNLVNQAISVTWRGGTPTVANRSRFGEHYLQLMQCWGDDDGTVPENPGPPPEQCVQGGLAGIYGGLPGGLFPPASFALSRVIARKTWPSFDPAIGHLDGRTGSVWRSFRPVDGPTVEAHTDPSFNPSVQGGNFWLNPYFNIVTTNEIAGGRTGPDGTGAELFEVSTGVESSGLGCGQRVQKVAGGEPRIPRCWLVVVPRGSAATENGGIPPEQAEQAEGVLTSPLSPAAWKHRIAVPLDFVPVDSPCDLADDQRRIDGTELALSAVSSWQPKLCSDAGLPPFAYGTVGDTIARRQVAEGAAGAAGMVVVSRPVDPETVDPARPIVYAPLTVSGVAIAFNVEREPSAGADPAFRDLMGVRVAQLNLTPRLVAKLLTQSYREQVAIAGPAPYDWAKASPQHLGLDPDFVRFNPEFASLSVRAAKNFGGLLLPSRSSDASQLVWDWIFADSEAQTWLEGAADEWGMKVNPAFAAKADRNSLGVAFGEPVPDVFPKADPYCYEGPPQGSGGSIVPPPLCGTDWLPYTASMRDAAKLTRAADDGARIVADPVATSPDQVWKRDIPQVIGTRAILSLTDTASAALFGLQMARLSAAGDGGSERTFIAPDVKGLTAGVESMRSKAEPTMREAEPGRPADGAYPLTALSYAAVSPLGLDDAARADYAAFLTYASGAGQTPGRDPGQLPAGYAPLPGALRAHAAEAANLVRGLRAPSAAPVDPASPAPSDVSIAGGTSARSGSSVTSRVASSAPASGLSSADPGPVVPDLQPVADEAPVEGVELASATRAVRTPQVDVAATRLALPLLAATALLAALGALEITKHRRRGVLPAETA